MGLTAENVAKKFNISRKEQQEFAIKSHVNACKSSIFKNLMMKLQLLKKRIFKFQMMEA